MGVFLSDGHLKDIMQFRMNYTDHDPVIFLHNVVQLCFAMNEIVNWLFVSALRIQLSEFANKALMHFPNYNTTYRGETFAKVYFVGVGSRKLQVG